MFEEQISEIRKQLGIISRAQGLRNDKTDEASIAMGAIGEQLDAILDSKVEIVVPGAEVKVIDDGFVRPWDGDTAELLRLLNVGRAALGGQPVPGFIRGPKNDYKRCPFARTLSHNLLPAVAISDRVRVNAEDVAERLATVWETEYVGKGVELPQRLAIAIDRFDDGSRYHALHQDF